jgi:hypothetical protein
MLYRLVVIAAWVCMTFIAYSTLSPIEARPVLASSPGLERVTAFALMGALFCLAYPRQWIFVLAIVLGSAALLELAQLLTPDRHGQLLDALQKMVGGTLGVLVILALRWSKWVKL